MKIIAIIPARMEEWCVAASVSSALTWADAVVVCAHCCTDKTASLARCFERVTVIEESDPTWAEARIRQRLLMTAIEQGATHVATIDADEILTANKCVALRQSIAFLLPGQVLKIPWLMLWGSMDRYRAGDESVWSSATAPVAFRVDGSVNYAAGADGYDIHTRVPNSLEPVHIWPERDGGLMHLQHVSRRRLVAKQTLYKLQEVLRWSGRESAETINRRYDPTVDETGATFRDVPLDWWGPEKTLVKPDAEPWQEAEVKRLLELHGRERFAGLNLHGF